MILSTPVTYFLPHIYIYKYTYIINEWDIVSRYTLFLGWELCVWHERKLKYIKVTPNLLMRHHWSWAWRSAAAHWRLQHINVGHKMKSKTFSDVCAFTLMHARTHTGSLCGPKGTVAVCTHSGQLADHDICWIWVGKKKKSVLNLNRRLLLNFRRWMQSEVNYLTHFHIIH